ncbi:MAG: 23S rRNA pseudouridine synthase F [Epulopiscium sp. Nuni2H_MBin003]|nr:MAG: 23S rRNA pseudouridine synthase F [Epulopiscium sp. Nuni2H_MBin003]
MRLNQYIASSGICSRRVADKLISDKKVKINNKIAVLGDIIKEGDVVIVDNKQITAIDKKIYIALNKPVGITCTTEKHVKGNIVDFIDYNHRIFPIGRLDKQSEGLILLTNDGSIVNKLLRKENNHEKEYIVKLDKDITAEFLHHIRKGVTIYNPVSKRHVKAHTISVDKLNKDTIKIILNSGLNHQIRRMCHALGYEVISLRRTRIVNLTLQNIKVGEWRYLTDSEVSNLIS